jgi:hypothetical protein
VVAAMLWQPIEVKLKAHAAPASQEEKLSSD